mgnify:CR=1 FL=1
MRKTGSRMLLLAAASVVPLALGWTPAEAVSTGEKGKSEAPAETDHTPTAKGETAPGKALGKGNSAAERGGSTRGGDTVSGDGGSVSAASGAEAAVETDDGVEAQAVSDAKAGVSEDESGTAVSAETTAETSISEGPDEALSSRTQSVSKDITTPFGERSISRSMTFTTLEDGTKIKTMSHAKAMALATPGVTKASAGSRADVHVQDEFGGEDAAVSGMGPGTADDLMDSPAISEANGG